MSDTVFSMQNQKESNILLTEKSSHLIVFDCIAITPNIILIINEMNIIIAT